MLSALNGLFRFLGWDECRLKFLKISAAVFRDGGASSRKMNTNASSPRPQPLAKSVWPAHGQFAPRASE